MAIIYYPQGSVIEQRNTSVGNQVVTVLNVPPQNVIFYFDALGNFTSQSITSTPTASYIDPFFPVTTCTKFYGFDGDLTDETVPIKSENSEIQGTTTTVSPAQGHWRSGQGTAYTTLDSSIGGRTGYVYLGLVTNRDIRKVLAFDAGQVVTSNIPFGADPTRIVFSQIGLFDGYNQVGTGSVGIYFKAVNTNPCWKAVLSNNSTDIVVQTTNSSSVSSNLHWEYRNNTASYYINNTLVATITSSISSPYNCDTLLKTSGSGYTETAGVTCRYIGYRFTY